MKKGLFFVAALFVTGLASAITTSVIAQDNSFPGEFSGNVTLTSDYVFRGFTQANEDPAIQGGLDWDSGAGFYAGTWASNVNFGDGDEASIEIDLYGGYTGEVENFSYDIGFLYYLYPGAAGVLNYDFWEVYGSIGYDLGLAAVSFGLAYSPENFGETDDGLYFQSGISVPLSDQFSIDVNLNYYDVDPAFGEDYLDWSVGGTLSFDGFDIDLRYVDTDISNCAGVCDGRAVFSISRTF
ncbi:MAG: TorF family putative porin [Rhodospirillaceae bacterium]